MLELFNIFSRLPRTQYCIFLRHNLYLASSRMDAWILIVDAKCSLFFQFL